MDFERSWLIKTCVDRRSHLEDVLEVLSSEKIFKDAAYSEQLCKKGNVLYSQNNHNAETHQEIFSQYSESISWAPLNSEELALAYENRSRFLLHMHKYEDCIKDIDKALKLTTSDVNKTELLCRKADCLKNLGSLEYQNEACHKTSSMSYEERTQVDEPPYCISIDSNEKYGRHLNATKDYRPGELIFSEQLYASVLNPIMYHTNCNYCLKVCWSSIPCNYCNWAMFCSEDCKQKGWKAFHDIECSVIPYLQEIFSNFFDSMSMSLRILLVGIRDAGSIVQLMDNLQVIDKCKDVCSNKTFPGNTIQSIYSLKSDGISDSKLETFASAALVVLMTLIKHSGLINNVEFKKIDDLLADENLVFLGSLLIKLTAIESINSFSFSHKNCQCETLKSLKSERNDCCERGYCLSPVACLINHSCCPNASMCFTEDQKIIIHALQPIKKYSQIFISYAGFYYTKSLKDRKKQLKEYNFICDCQACIESWPPFLLLPELLMEPNHQLKISAEIRIYRDCKSIFTALGTKKHINFKQEHMDKLSKAILQLENLNQPSFLASLLIEALGTVYSSIYGLKSPNFIFIQDCSNDKD